VGGPHALVGILVLWDSPLMGARLRVLQKQPCRLLIVAVVTQLTTGGARAVLENRKTRRFSGRSRHESEARGLRGLDIFLAPCKPRGNVTDVNQLGPVWRSRLRRSNARR